MEEKYIDQGLVFGALLTDLSKAFDCLSHELLVAKLSAYGMEDSAVRFISDYYIKRKQTTKIGNNSVLGKMFFLVHLKDQF